MFIILLLKYTLEQTLKQLQRNQFSHLPAVLLKKVYKNDTYSDNKAAGRHTLLKLTAVNYKIT